MNTKLIYLTASGSIREARWWPEFMSALGRVEGIEIIDAKTFNHVEISHLMVAVFDCPTEDLREQLRKRQELGKPAVCLIHEDSGSEPPSWLQDFRPFHCRNASEMLGAINSVL